MPATSVGPLAADSACSIDAEDIPGQVGRQRTTRDYTSIVILVALAVAFAWPYNVTMLRNVARDQHMGDFGRLYYSVRQSNAGLSMYGASPVEFRKGIKEPLLNLNPPHAHLPVLAIAPLGEAAAFWIALLLAGAAFILCARAALGAAGVESRAMVLLIAVSAPLAAPVQAALGTGQFFAFWLMGPATLAWLAARRGRWTSAGAWLGILASLKLFGLIFLPYLLIARRWRAAAAFAGAAAANVALGIAVFGPLSYADWLRGFGEATWTAHQLNGSWLGFFERLMGHGLYEPALRGHAAIATWGPIWSAQHLVRPAAAALAIATGVASFVLRHALHRPRPERSGVRDAERSAASQVDRSFATLFLAALLISPLGWTYYLPLALGPLLVLAATDIRFGRAAAVVLPVALLPIQFIDVMQPSPLATLTFGSASFWLVLGLWRAAAFQSGRSHPGDKSLPPGALNVRE